MSTPASSAGSEPCVKPSKWRTTWLSQSWQTSRWITWGRKASLAVIDQGLMSGSNFLLMILLARWLSAAQYGAFALAFSIFLLLAAINDSLINEPMMVFGPSSFRHCKREYLGSVLCIQGAVGLTFLILLVLSTLVANHFAFAPIFSSTLAGLSLSTPCVLILWVARYAYYLEQRPGRAAIGALLYSILVISATSAVYKRGLLSPRTAFLVLAASALIAAVFMLLRLKPLLRLTGDASPGRVWIEHWNYGRWALGTAALKWIPGNISYSLTGAFLGIADVGALKALLNLVLPFSQAINSFSILVQPHVSGVFARGGRGSTKAPVAAVTLFYLAGGLIYTAILMFVKYPVFRMLYRGKFLEFVYLLPWVSVGIVLTLGSYGAIIGLRAIQNPSMVFVAYCASSATSLVFGTLATWAFGLRGIVVSFILSGLVTLLVAVYLFHREVQATSSSFGGQHQFYEEPRPDAGVVDH